MDLALELQKITSDIKFNESMSRHTSFRLGGPVDIFIEVGDEEKLRKIVELVYRADRPYFILGGGTNFLVRDKGIRGVVIKLVGEFKKIAVSDRGLIVGAGVSLSRVVNWASAKGLSGLEFAVGIPGTVGGAVVGNAGVAEKSIGDCITTVRVMDKQGTGIKKLIPKNGDFSYRNSHLKKYIVLDVEILLTKNKIYSIVNRVEEYKQKRKNTQPIKVKSAGCIFKNPPDNFAGKLIDEAGLKGLRVGGAYVSHKHANFILNDGTATATDVLNLISMIKKKVLDKFGRRLEEEIVIVGEE